MKLIHCSKCSTTKESSEFHKDPTRSSGHSSCCKLCKRKYVSKRQRWRGLERYYGITLEQFDSMLEAQGGVCAICGSVNHNGRRLDIDHNHKTGKIRGLLCQACNIRLGFLENGISAMKDHVKALNEYLNEYDS